jgi:hypothetical protein
MIANARLFTHLHVADPFVDERFTYVRGAVFIHVVVDKLQVVELQRVRRGFGGGVGQDLIRLALFPRQLLGLFDSTQSTNSRRCPGCARPFRMLTPPIS